MRRWREVCCCMRLVGSGDRNMQWMSLRKLMGVIAGTVGALLLVPCASAGRADHPYRYSVVDMPVSLSVGTVRTPEFSPPTHWYWILLQVEKPLPFDQMQCMMGVTTNRFDSKNCTSDDPLLRADWTVWEDGQIALSGSSTTKADAKYSKENIFKFLGKFPALSGKKYVLKVKFTKDETPLNVANPHLIVTKIGDE
jgi:hypothetical protein